MTREYLNQLLQLDLSDEHKEFLKYLWDNGTDFGGQSSIRKTYFKPKLKMCYNNSVLAVIAGNYDYYEGYFVTEGLGFPLEHAWNVCKETGEVVDFTSALLSGNVIQRYGVKVPRESIMEMRGDDFIMSTPLRYYYATKILSKDAREKQKLIRFLN